MSLREVFFLFISTYLLNQFQFTYRQYKVLKTILLILIIAGLVLTTLTYVMGGEAFMTMLVGYYNWGIDEDTKFQISFFLGEYWRSPGAVGSSAGTAYFALFAYYIFDLKKRQRFLKLLAFALLFSTFTRSAILCLVIYEFLKFLSVKKNIILLQNHSSILVGFVIISIALLSQSSIFSIESVVIRIEVWLTEISVHYNLFYGGRIGQVGGAIRGDGPEAILDSYWLYLLYSTGLIGIALWFIFFFRKARVSKRKCFFIVGIIFSGFFIHLTQAITFLVMFPLIFANYDAIQLKDSTQDHKTLVQ